MANSKIINEAKLSESTLRAYERLSKDSPLVYGGPIKTLLDAYEMQEYRLNHLQNDLAQQLDELNYLRNRVRQLEGRR